MSCGCQKNERKKKKKNNIALRWDEQEHSSRTKGILCACRTGLHTYGLYQLWKPRFKKYTGKVEYGKKKATMDERINELKLKKSSKLNELP